MFLRNCFALATLLYSWRWILLALSFGVGLAIWYFMVIQPENWRSTLMFGIPAISAFWVGAACGFCLHPERGLLSETGWLIPWCTKRGWAPRKHGRVIWNEFRHHTAMTLHLYFVVGCLGMPLVLALIG